MSDTGLDMGHCYFVDDNFDPVGLYMQLSGEPLAWKQANHRKVIQYTITNTGMFCITGLGRINGERDGWKALR